MKWIGKLWTRLSTPAKNWALGTLLVAGFIVGAIFVWGFNTALEISNTEGFCLSCHTMSSTTGVEYQGTVHDVSRTGKRAICSDCHVPEKGIALLIRKMQASNDVYQHFIGRSISTPEKFEARRGHLASREWTRMKKSDSAGCRSCHLEESMDLSLQNKRARMMHTVAKETGQTCIDCHKGIAHQLPENYLELEKELNEKFKKKESAK